MGDFIKRLRAAADFAGVGSSQSDIAESLGLSRQTVNRWFRGGEPNAELTLEIARKYRVSAHWLKTGLGEMLPPPSDSLLSDEKELIRYYRSATPQVRHVISTMVRAVRKSVVVFSLAIPPLMAPSPADAHALHNIFSLSGLNTHCLRRLFAWLRSRNRPTFKLCMNG